MCGFLFVLLIEVPCLHASATYTLKETHTYTHIDTHTHTHRHTHTHTHTHTFCLGRACPTHPRSPPQKVAFTNFHELLHTHESYGGGGHAHGSVGPSDGKLGGKSDEGAAVTTGSKDSSKDDDLGLDKSSTGALLLWLKLLLLALFFLILLVLTSLALIFTWVPTFTQ
jgi:hypothetical protein